MYLLAPFIMQYFKKILRADPELWDVPFSGPKLPICPEQIFLGYKPLLLLSSTYWPFSLNKILKKILTLCPELWGCTPKWCICLKQLFLEIINIILIYLLASFIVQTFNKILLADPELRGWATFGPKIVYLLK